MRPRLRRDPEPDDIVRVGIVRHGLHLELRPVRPSAREEPTAGTRRRPSHQHAPGLHSKLRVCGLRGGDCDYLAERLRAFLRSITLSWRWFPTNQALDAKFGSDRITECRCTDEPQVRPNRV